MLLLNNTREYIVVYRMVSKSLNVCCWNVNSLFNRVNGVRTNKLDDPLFLQSLNSEIIILTETHACKNDIFLKLLMDTFASQIVAQSSLVG